MNEFHSSLLREKFTIQDSTASSGDQEPIIALSNRLIVELTGQKKAHKEIFIVRAQNMHSCVRMAARILKSYKTSGPLMNRTKPFDWEAAWDVIVNDYEYRFNPHRWVAVYHNGRILFQAGEHHLLLDVIEQCDAKNAHRYEKAVPMAEDAFKKAGKVVKIEYDSNVALVINLAPKQGRFGVIMRGPNRTTTFNFSINAKKDPLNYAQCLAAAACFLEGVQLAFMVGMNNIKLYLGIIKRHTNEEKQTKEAGRRLGRLNAEIANLERAYDVHYRPEKPEFGVIVTSAEQLGQKILTPPEENDDDEDTIDTIDNHEDDHEDDHADNTF